MTGIAATIAAGPNFSGLLTVGATVLAALIAIGSALGGFAAFRTGRTNAVAASAVARATEAEKTAEIWRQRSEATQSAFAAYREETARATDRSNEALSVAQHQIEQLQQKVATLEGVVTARHDIKQLTQIVTSLSATVSSMLGELRTDHTLQQESLQAILDHLGTS